MRIVVRGLDVRGVRRVQERLAEAGHDATAIVGARAAPEGADLLIFEGAHEAAAPFAQEVLTGDVRPLAVLRACPADAPPPRGLASLAPFDAALAIDGPKVLLARQISAAIRAGVAEEERMRRRATAAALAVAPPPLPDPRRLRALYIGAPSAFYLKLEHALARQDGLLTAAFTSFTGFDHLHDDDFDAVVLNAAADASTALALCAALRRNASLATLPTMLVAKAGDDASLAQAIERGAAAVAMSDAQSAAALGWLFDAIRCERRRKLAAHESDALRDRMGDARTGLFKPAAFAAHLDRLAEDHHATGRPLALAALHVLPAHGARRPAPALWKKGFTEISSLAQRLIRYDDSGAAFADDTIALALPATPLAGARRAGGRVASVAECTAFATGDGGAAPLVFEQAAVELQPGESGAGLLARARAVFAPESVRA